ncbi:MAG: hypothetical protein ACK44E_12165, partial [Anaerolineales bacterium]
SVVITYAVALPFIFNHFLEQGITVRLLISAALLFPLGLLMGIPFPAGLKIFKQSCERDIGWMWGINGVASVLGSILAVVLAIAYGFTWVLLLGGACYFIEAFVIHPNKKQLLKKLL